MLLYLDSCNSVQAKNIAIPADTALATHTRSAQMQNKVEQQQLKQLVLNYEQREESEEMKGRFPNLVILSNRD